MVLVEGASDRVALETLAVRLGRDLAREGVQVVELGGATNVARCLVELAATDPHVRLAGLYDVAEERFFRRGRSEVQHLRRFLGTRSWRKAAYAGALVEAVPLDQVPPPLTAVLERV